jgi:hypothetical protein
VLLALRDDGQLHTETEELDSPAVTAIRREIAVVKQCWSVIGWVIKKKNYLELLRASEGTLSRWSLLHLQWLAPTNPHWVMARSPYM